jgi:hypothetical protein
MLYRRPKRKNPNPQVSRNTLQYPVSDEDIDLVPTKSSSRRYPQISAQDFGSNLSVDEKDSSFEPMFTPAIISISSQ